MSPKHVRFLQALLTSLFGLGLAVAIGSGFHLVHDRSPLAQQLHELFGWGIGVAAAVHVALRWRWFASLARGAGRLKGPVRTNLLLGVLLALVVGLQVASGALLEPGSSWRGVHHLAGKLVILTGLWHVARHWSWLRLRLGLRAASRRVEAPSRETC